MMTQKLQLLCLNPAFFPNSIDSRYNSVMSLYCLPKRLPPKNQRFRSNLSFQSFFNSNSILTRSSFDLYPVIFTTKLYYTSKNSFFSSIIIVFFFFFFFTIIIVIIYPVPILSFRIRCLLTESSARFGCTRCRKKRTKRTKAAGRAAIRVANRAASRAGQRTGFRKDESFERHARTHVTSCSVQVRGFSEVGGGRVAW
ncbi:hypothetical protein FIM1_1182 [Kluyveromyces marxianus]|uniref:Transmembrane protein n=1 Tax=Kluyveromyces marxianus TaxID=4911 RepID=A0ABX6EQE2_KLUMA|nr:hypothetical protein FIM1_1182 [Kluyveromyces marxianus]